MKSLVLSIFVITCMMAANVAVGQQAKENAHWGYSGIVQGGVLGGSSTVTYTVQTVQGIRKNNWFTGIGVGYDHYGMPGIPIVLHGQKAFGQQKNRVFTYAQAGLQVPVKAGDWDDKSWNGRKLYDLETGYVGELGGGYLIGVGKTKKTALIFSAGYSYKFCKTTAYSYGWNDFPPYNDVIYSTEKQTYHYRRIAIKAGFAF